MPHHVVVSRHQADRDKSKGDEPVFIRGPQMQRTGPDGFLIQKQVLRKVRRTETGCDSRPLSILLGWTRFGRFCPMTVVGMTIVGLSVARMTVVRVTVFSLLADTRMNTWSDSFEIGCPARVQRTTGQQSNRYRLTKMPPEFVQEKHLLQRPVQIGLRVRLTLTGEVGCQHGAAGGLRHGYQIVGIDLYRHTLHDRIEREHHSKVIFLADQNALHSNHGAGLDADTLPQDEISVGLYIPSSEARAERFDFKIGEGCEVSSKTDQRQHPRHFEHAPALPRIDVHEHVIGKKGQLEIHLATILPAMARGIKRQERFNLALAKVRGHAFFMMRIDVGRKPVRGKFLSRRQPLHLLFSDWWSRR